MPRYDDPDMPGLHMGRDDSVVPEGEAMREIIRKWLPYLDGNELKVLLFIFDRTIMYRKRFEYITYRQFEYGIVSRDYADVYYDLVDGNLSWDDLPMELKMMLQSDKIFINKPVGISNRMIRYAIKSLEEKGVIYCKQSGKRGVIYGIDTECVFDDVTFIKNMSPRVKMRKQRGVVTKRPVRLRLVR